MSMKSALLTAASLLVIAGAAQAATIKGKVTDGSGKAALEGAIVTVQETGQRAVTGRFGDVTISNIEPGDYTLSVSYLGAETQTVSVSVTDTANFNVALGDSENFTTSVIVLGQRGALLNSINQERAADSLVTVLASDALGNLPDENVAEAARRATGVSIQNDQGEGRFIVIRGINPTLNATQVNGARLPSPEAGSRSVALDVIDADVLDAITITKALTPDMDGDAIGGAIDIKTLSAFDYDDTLFKAKLGGRYSDLSGAWGPRLSATAAKQFFGGDLGVAGSLAWQEREFGSENVEVDGSWFQLPLDSAAGPLAIYPDELEFRDYDVTRERLTASLNFDWIASDYATYSLRTLYSDFRDQEYRTRIEIPFEDLVDEDANDDEFVDTGAELEVDRDIKDREETQEMFSVVLAGEYQFDGVQLDWTASYGKSEEGEPNRLDTSYRGEFDFPIAPTNNNSQTPGLSLGDAAAFNDGSNYEFDEAVLLNGLTTDEELAFAANAQFDVNYFGRPGIFKFGGKYAARDKEYNVDAVVYEDDNDVFGATVADVQGQVDYPFINFGPAFNPGLVRSFILGNTDQLTIKDDDTFIESNVADFEAEENVGALYVMAQVDIDALRLTGGVRAEITDYKAQGLVVDEENLTATPNRVNNDYVDWLPSIHARYEISPNLVGRASYFRSLARPDFVAATPFAVFNDDFEGEGGNPDINRQIADSFDVNLAWYPNEDGVIMGGFFYKQIEDFIAPIAFEDVTVYGVDFEELETFVNLPEATVTGFEVNVQQLLTFLPSPFDGLLIGANYTWVDAEADIPALVTFAGQQLSDGNGARTIVLPGQAEQVGNLIVGYDKGRFDVRAAMTYRDGYLDEIGSDDRFVDAHTQFDLSAKFKITDQWTVYGDFTNLNDEAFYAYRQTDFGQFNSQYEEYSWQAQFGVQFKY